MLRRADGIGDNHVAIDDEQHAVAVSHREIEDLMAMPEDALQFLTKAPNKAAISELTRRQFDIAPHRARLPSLDGGE